MKKILEHTFWIDSLSLSDVKGDDYIPTLLCYLGDNEIPKYGKNAVEIEKNEKIINRNFKVELGNISP